MTTILDIKKEVSMNAIEANIKTIRLVVPIILLFGVPYYAIWDEQFSIKLVTQIAAKTWQILFFIIAGAIVHELIHGLFWALYSKKGMKSIKFGMAWRSLTPYCHCKEPLKMKHYRLGAIMPAVLLGFVPATLSLFTGNLGLFGFGVFFSIAAGGDLLMIWLLRNENRDDLVQDHPEKIGCLILN